MSNNIKETALPPRSPDEYNFWKYHVDNTDKWDHPTADDSVFSPDSDDGSRDADNNMLDDTLSTPDISADWVDELLSNMKDTMRHYKSPSDIDVNDEEEDFVYESATSKVWNWWNKTTPKDIAKKVKSASLSELIDMTKGIPEKSARRLLSGPKLVEYRFALKRLKKMEGDLNESHYIDEEIKPGVIEFGEESVEISEDDANVLNRLYNSLNDKNQKKLEEKMNKDMDSYNDVLSFAKEKFGKE